MPLFVPFQGLRYKVGGKLTEYLCPPYDIITPKEREKLIDSNPDNIVSVELPSGGESRYDDAAAHLAKMIASGLLLTDRDDNFYVFQMSWTENGIPKAVEGVIGRLRLEPFSAGAVLPHENTLTKAKSDRLNLMKATAANISPVYSLFSDADGEVRKMISEAMQKSPAASAEFDGVTHSIYTVRGVRAAEMSGALASKTLFIADGHHRYETGLAYKAYRESLGETVDDTHPAAFIMMALIPLEHEGLTVLPTHRVVNFRDDFSGETLLGSLSHDFDIIPADKAEAERLLEECYKENKTAFLFYDGAFSVLRLKPGAALTEYMPQSGEALRNLDVSVLHSVVLEAGLGIDAEDMAAGKSLEYTRDFDYAVSAVDSKKASCAFILNPTRVSEIAAVAQNRERMPQKSTYFYPKLITGLVINKM